MGGSTEIIKRPIDMTNIRERLDGRKYKDWDQFERNMLLVFANAKTYNVEGSEIFEDANALEEAFMATKEQAFS